MNLRKWQALDRDLKGKKITSIKHINKEIKDLGFFYLGGIYLLKTHCCFSRSNGFACLSPWLKRIKTKEKFFL